MKFDIVFVHEKEQILKVKQVLGSIEMIYDWSLHERLVHHDWLHRHCLFHSLSAWLRAMTASRLPLPFRCLWLWFSLCFSCSSHPSKGIVKRLNRWLVQSKSARVFVCFGVCVCVLIKNWLKEWLLTHFASHMPPSAFKHALTHSWDNLLVCHKRKRKT